MKLQRDARDCPKCGAHRGFACHSFDAMPGCPQLQGVPDEDPSDIEIASMPPLWPLGIPSHDDEPKS